VTHGAAELNAQVNGSWREEDQNLKIWSTHGLRRAACCVRSSATGCEFIQTRPLCLDLGVQEHFDGALRSQDGRWLLAQNLPAVIGKSPRRCPHRRPDLPRLISERRGVQLEGGLDQRDELRARRQEPPVDLADGAGDGEIGQVHRHQFRWLGDETTIEVSQVGPLQIDHLRVRAQAAAQLASARIHRVDTRGARVQQRLGEAARRRAKVERDGSGRADAKGAQGAAELDRAAQWAGTLDPDGSVGAHARPGVGGGRAIDHDRALADQPGGLVEIREAAPQQGKERHESGALAPGHGGFSLSSDRRKGPSDQGGPRARPVRQARQRASERPPARAAQTGRQEPWC